jgi:N-dimethylarginine dimethylaminohydrolase
MVSPLRAVVVKRPEQAFRSSAAIDAEWKELGWTRPPDLDIAAREHRQLVSLLETAGARVYFLPEDSRTNLDSIYTHDPVLITDAGAVILQTGKKLRRGEGPAMEDALNGWGIPILGAIEGGATAEASDMIWLDRQTLLVGRGFRTNQAGIDWLSSLMQPLGVSVIPVSLPYWTGPDDVLHLMSFISLLDVDLAVVYRRLLPVPLYELLVERGVKLVDVLEDEYPSLGCNVLAVGPRQLVMVSGNPITRSRLEARGCTVSEFDGSEICIPGSGGPTSITRPLLRV